jgi:hypothetical protein
VTSGFIFIMESDELFRDEDFFPDISSLYDDMGDNNGNVNGSTSAVPYVLLILLLEIVDLLTFLELAFSYSLLDGMSSLFPLFLAMFYLLFFLVNLYGNFLYFQHKSRL